MPQNTNSFQYLFSQQFIELGKFFADFKSFRTETSQIGSVTQVPEVLRVLYGTPAAAFRRIFNIDPNNLVANQATVNNKPNLPVLNFHCASFKRIYSQENPFVRLTGTVNNIYKDYHGQKVNATMRAPQHWECTLACALWTDSYKTRDDMISKIVLSFPGSELYLQYQPNASEFPDEALWIPIRMEENIEDATEIEGFTEKETRDVIRTNFTLVMQCVLAYETTLNPYIENIQFNLYEKPRDEDNGILIPGGYQLHVLSAEPFSFEIIKPVTLNTPVPPTIP